MRFSERVAASLAATDFVLTDRTTGNVIPTSGLALQYDSVADLAYLAVPTLADGNYRLSVAPNGISDPAGNPLAADYAFDFFVLAGDANHARHVDFNDLVVLAQHYNTTLPAPLAAPTATPASAPPSFAPAWSARTVTPAPPPASAPAKLDAKKKPIPVFSQAPVVANPPARVTPRAGKR